MFESIKKFFGIEAKEKPKPGRLFQQDIVYGTDLKMFLGAEKKMMKRLTKIISDTTGIRNDY
jgi:hypothetical protein